MGLRPAHTCRDPTKPAWSRFSKRKPRKSFVKSMPHNSLQVTSMGKQAGYYTIQVDLVATRPIQVRDNALESARQTINKLLENTIPQKYHFFIRTLPLQVIREVKMAFGAGADRIQKGMKHAWGRPSDRAARLKKGSIVFSVRANPQDIPVVKAAYKRAKNKMPGSFRVVVLDKIYGVKPTEED